MIRKIISLSLCIVLCFTCSSCVFKFNVNDSNDLDNDSNDLYQNKTLKLEDIIGVPGVYCLHTDGTVTSVVALSSVENSLYSGTAPLVVDRSNGDQLIFVMDLDTKTSDVDRFWRAEQYYGPDGDAATLTSIEEFEGVKLEANVKNDEEKLGEFLELFGITFYKTGSDIYKNEVYGYFLSKKLISYTYGYYEGTQWKKMTKTNNVLFYEQLEPTISYMICEFRADIIKGQNGYFTFDLAEIKSGLYINNFDYNSILHTGGIYAIEIK